MHVGMLTWLWPMQEDTELVSPELARQSMGDALQPSYQYAASAMQRLAVRPELRRPIADAALSGLIRLAQGAESETCDDAVRTLAQLMCDIELKEDMMATATPDVAQMLQQIWRESQAYFITRTAVNHFSSH